MNLLPKKVSNKKRYLLKIFYLTSKRRKFVPEYFETNISYLPVNNIGENIQSFVFFEEKNTSSTLYEDDVIEYKRRTVVS